MVWDDTIVTGKEGVDVQVRVFPKDTKTETDPDNNFATQNVSVVEIATVTTSFVTNIILLVMTTAIVVVLSGRVKKRH